MAQQIVNVGAAANDGTGDTLRLSQQKANANFTELYGIAGSSSTLQAVTDIGNTTDNNIEFSSGVGVLLDNTSTLRKGTIDAGYGGANGIAQICSVGYELKWEAGRLYVMGDGGTTIREVSHNFTTTPAATDDISKGFIVGSRWILDDGTLYICSDNTSTAAVWDLQTSGGSQLTRQEFSYTSSQDFTLSGTPSFIYAVFVNGQELNSSQYSFITTTLTIADTLESGDKINILYTPTTAGILEYYTKAEIDAFDYESNHAEFIEVNELTDLPAAISGVITLTGGYTYLFLKHIDLLGSRLVCGQDTVIVGWSSENCSISSTGLSAATALITSVYSLPIRNISFTHALVFDLQGDGTTTALDWFGVNLLNCASGGTISNYTNFVAGDSALLNSGGFIFDGTIGTIAFSNCLFDTASTKTAITVLSTCTVSRRLRIIYSSFVTLSGETGVNFSTSATVGDEKYILDTVNFSGGGTYISGVDNTSNKALFANCVGITNTSTRGFMYMVNNTTDTTIGMPNVNVWVKAAGTTTANANNSKYTHTSNRLTYTGSFSTSFQVSVNCNVRSGSPSQVISVGVAKNGTILAESEMTIRTDISNQEYPGSTAAQVDLTTNDYIEIFVKNTSTSSLRIADLNVSITKIPV